MVAEFPSFAATLRQRRRRSTAICGVAQTTTLDLRARPHSTMVGNSNTDDITLLSTLGFLDFVHLFRAFNVRSRRDIKDLFDRISVPFQGDLNLPDGKEAEPGGEEPDADFGECWQELHA